MKKLKSTLNEDIQLFTSIQKGDKKAFDLFFLKYYPRLCSYACQYVNFDNSEEIVQEIMIWLWENRNMIKIESSPIPYLFRAVRNNCLRQKNRDELKNKILTILYNHTNTPYDNPNFYIEEELIRKIEKSIQDLPQRKQHVPGELLLADLGKSFDPVQEQVHVQLADGYDVVWFHRRRSLRLMRLKAWKYLSMSRSMRPSTTSSGS